MNAFKILCVSSMTLNTAYICYKIYTERQNAKPHISDIKDIIPIFTEVYTKIFNRLNMRDTNDTYNLDDNNLDFNNNENTQT